MMFRGATIDSVNIEMSEENNCRLESALEKIANNKMDVNRVRDFLLDMVKMLRYSEGDMQRENLFLMYDEPRKMPADARVEFVYKPTYYGVTIMMTALNRFPTLCEDDLFLKTLRKMLNAAMGRNFMGAGWESYDGFLETMEIFARGDVVEFMGKHREINTHFAEMLDAAIQILETEICSGNLKSAGDGRNYRDRAKNILEMLGI